jgi:hypothetical protein
MRGGYDSPLSRRNVAGGGRVRRHDRFWIDTWPEGPTARLEKADRLESQVGYIHHHDHRLGSAQTVPVMTSRRRLEYQA